MASPSDPPIKGAPRFAWMDRFAARQSRAGQGMILGLGAGVTTVSLLAARLTGTMDGWAPFLVVLVVFGVAQALTVRFAISAAKNGAWNH